MGSARLIRLIEALILFNTYNYDECRDYIMNFWLEDDLRFKAILKMIDLIEFIRNEKFNQLQELVQEILDIVKEIEDDEFNRKFKDLMNQIIDDFKVPGLGFPRKKIVINWHLLV